MKPSTLCLERIVESGLVRQCIRMADHDGDHQWAPDTSFEEWLNDYPEKRVHLHGYYFESDLRAAFVAGFKAARS